MLQLAAPARRLRFNHDGRGAGCERRKGQTERCDSVYSDPAYEHLRLECGPDDLHRHDCVKLWLRPLRNLHTQANALPGGENFGCKHSYIEAGLA